jgi:hypothetical protein
VYDPDEWRHYAGFAGFLAENCDRWPFPKAVRDGLVRDAAELVKCAQDRCTDPPERRKLQTLSRIVENLKR